MARRRHEALEMENLAVGQKEGFTALHEAALNLDIQEIQRLIEQLGLDVNATDDDGRSPLHYVQLSEFDGEDGEYKRCITLLLTKGANINLHDKEGKIVIN